LVSNGLAFSNHAQISSRPDPLPVHAYACQRKLRARSSLALPVSSAASVPRSKDDAGEEPVPKTTTAEYTRRYVTGEALACKTIRRRRRGGEPRRMCGRAPRGGHAHNLGEPLPGGEEDEEAEVDYLELRVLGVVREQEVLRLEVPVDDAAGMAEADDVHDGVEDGSGGALQVK
jgi:hypothetical protein